ncbi:MAG: ribonuclease R [Erysipelotrichaceae bacterium]|nr:ribonuclease R [Erysipelotrichaceae bacterium]
MNKNEVFDLIASKSGKFDVHGIMKVLNLESTEEFIELNKILNELEDEALVARSSKERYCLLNDLDLYKGTVSLNRKGFGFLDLEDISIYIPARALETAMDGDEVVVKRRVYPDGTADGKVVRILKRNTKMLIGTFRGYKALHFEVDGFKSDTFVRVKNQYQFPVVPGTKAAVKILRYGDPMIAEVTEILGHENDPGMDVTGALLARGIHSEFPEEVHQQLKEFEDHVTETQKIGRKDLTNRLIVTMDGADAKDLDDAICLEKTKDGYRLGVHIADVSSYVKENSPLDNEARARGTSVYVVDRVVPMLPQFLSNGLCSLNPHVERLTLSCEMEIDHDGKVIGYEIYPSFIKSSYRLTYDDVNQLLNGEIDEKDAALKNMLFLMSECAQKVRTQRYQKGAMDFDKEEAKIIVDEDGDPIDVVPRVRGEAERIIEDFMILANECVANHTRWLEIPSLYRVHEAPDAQKIRDLSRMTRVLGYVIKGSAENIHPSVLQKCLEWFKDQESYPVVSTIMLRSMAKARYDAKCLGHFGLGSEEYTHFTSPIRRYPDLVVHRMLHRYSFNTELDLTKRLQDEILMEEIGVQTSVLERRAVDAERDVEDMKKAEYMEMFIGTVHEGIISGVTKYGMYVQLANTIEGLVHVSTMEDDHYFFDSDTYSLMGNTTGNLYRLGDKVKIKVLSADKQKHEIDFVLCRKHEKSQKKQRLEREKASWKKKRQSR